MAYSINPNLPKARALAMRLLIDDALPLQVVANRCGVHRSTIWRWKAKWLKINEYVQFANYNRPNRVTGIRSRLIFCRWLIPTNSSRPRTSPKMIGRAVIEQVLELRNKLHRCAEVIWHHLVYQYRVRISLS
jgi:hypothetical protein